MNIRILAQQKWHKIKFIGLQTLNHCRISMTQSSPKLLIEKSLCSLLGSYHLDQGSESILVIYSLSVHSPTNNNQ